MASTKSELREELAALRRRVAEIEAALGEPAPADPVQARCALTMETTGVVLFSAPAGSDRLDFVAGATERVLGYQPAEMVGTEGFWQRLILPEDAMELGRGIEVLASTGRADMSIRVQPRTGGPRWVRVVMQVLSNEHGAPARVDGVIVDLAERETATQAVHESETRFQQLAESIRDVFWSMDLRSGRMLYVSPAYEEIWGRPASEPLTHGIVAVTQHVHPEDAARFPILTPEILSAGPGPAEYRVIRPDGTIRWVKSRIFPVRDERGEVIRLTGVTADITDERRAEEELRASRAFLRVVLDSLPVQVAVLDGDGAILSVNAAWTAFAEETGCADALACVGRAAFDACAVACVTDPELAARVERGVADVLAGRAAGFEVEHPAGAGGQRWFLLRVTPVGDRRSGLPLRAAAVLSQTDVTERRRATDEARRSGALYQRIVEHGWDFVTLADREGRIHYASGAWRRLLGVAPAALVGGIGSRRLHRDDMANRDAVRARVLATPGETGEYEGRLRHADGHWVWTEVRLANLLDEPDVRAVVTIGHEITLRKEAADALQRVNAELEQRVAERTAELSQANAALSRASRAKDEFLAGMSHELRTPLNAVLGLSEALLEDIYGPLTDRQQTTVRRIEESGRHLLSLINDILDLSKIEAGKSAIELDAVDVDELCRASIRMVQDAARKKHLKISQRLRGGFGAVLADERRLKQVLVNLLSNAVKFTPEGGKIGLDTTLDPDAGTLTLEVWDSGIGMSAEEIGRLFQPFMQLDAGLDRRHAGTGLGLALVRRIVDQHGGTVSVQSEPGQGSRFTVALPARTPPPTPSLAALAPRPLTRALVIDASLTDAEHLERYLVESGVEPILHATAEGAVDRAAEERPDVVFLDLLESGGGWELLHALKTDPRTAAIPVVLTSVLDRPADGAAAEADDYIVKPVSRTLMSETLTGLAAARAASPSAGPEPRPLGPRRILLAEDAETNIGTLDDFLCARGYQVLVARDGREAVTMARAERPDLILMDIQMPILDGLAATRELRADPSPEVRQIPIIALTALAMAGDRERCLGAGADDYLTKPISLKQLGAALEARLR
jgi:PAS domain S-box-containing protein